MVMKRTLAFFVLILIALASPVQAMVYEAPPMKAHIAYKQDPHSVKAKILEVTLAGGASLSLTIGAAVCPPVAIAGAFAMGIGALYYTFKDSLKFSGKSKKTISSNQSASGQLPPQVLVPVDDAFLEIPHSSIHPTPINIRTDSIPIPDQSPRDIKLYTIHEKASALLERYNIAHQCYITFEGTTATTYLA